MKDLSEKITGLAKRSGGELLVPGNDGYDEARKIWNGMFDKKPRVISRCKSVGDVVESVNFARQNELLVAVRGGGHNSAGTASCDDGMMIDLSLMNKVEVSESGGTAVAQGGCLLSDLDEGTQEYGLAVPGGIISHTGVGGLTLGGGFGWISRKYGLSVDNLISAEVVTADGRVVTASDKENPDLFWAIRGGGGNFGIVTSFKFRCANIGNEIYSGLIIKRFEDMEEYMKFHRGYVRTLPDEMTVWVVIRHAPPLPFIPAEVHGRLVVVVAFAWLGEMEEGRQLMQPIRNITANHGEGSGMNPWVGWQSAFDGLVTHGARNYWKSHDLTGLPDELIGLLKKYSASMPTGECEVFIPHMEGAPSRIASDRTAFSFRTMPFVLNIHTRWQDKSQDGQSLKWAREFHEATRPFSHGVYVNFLSDEGKDRIKEAYTAEVWHKLVKVKGDWDPGNFFRVNQNISPNGG